MFNCLIIGSYSFKLKGEKGKKLEREKESVRERSRWGRQRGREGGKVELGKGDLKKISLRKGQHERIFLFGLKNLS